MNQTASVAATLSYSEDSDGTSSATFGLHHLETMDQIAFASVASPGLVYYGLCIAYLVVVTTVGLGLNAMFLVCYLTQSRLRTQMATLNVNLCIADLLISVSSLVKAVHMATGTRMEEGQPMCTMFGFLTFIGGIESLFSLMTIALYRYSVVTQRITSKSVTFRQMFTIIAILWTVGLGLASGPLFGWNQYVPDQPDTWCTLKWNDRSTAGISYLAVMFSVVFLLPVGTMIFAYTSIWLTLKKVSSFLGHSTARQTCKAEKALARSSLLMSACFLLAWLPYAILVMCIFLRIAPTTLPYYLAVIPPMMCKASPCLNPIVYLRTSPEIRKYLHQWRECFHSMPEPDSGDEQNIELDRATIMSKSSLTYNQAQHNGRLQPSKEISVKYSKIPATNKESNVEAEEQLDVGNQAKFVEAMVA